MNRNTETPFARARVCAHPCELGMAARIADQSARKALFSGLMYAVVLYVMREADTLSGRF